MLSSSSARRTPDRRGTGTPLPFPLFLGLRMNQVFSVQVVSVSSDVASAIGSAVASSFSSSQVFLSFEYFLFSVVFMWAFVEGMSVGSRT